MKQLTCEMCGSTELVKQEGNFVCQNCGTKYSVEEAKKMMGGNETQSGDANPEVQAKLNPEAELKSSSTESSQTTSTTASEDQSMVSDTNNSEETSGSEESPLSMGISAETNTMSGDNDYDELVKLGNAAFDRGDYDLAYDYFVEAKKQKTEDPQVIYREALCFMAKEYMLTPTVGEMAKSTLDKAFNMVEALSDEERNEYAKRLVSDFYKVFDACKKKWEAIVDKDTLKYKDSFYKEIVEKTIGLADTDTQFRLFYDLASTNQVLPVYMDYFKFIENCAELYPNITISKEEQKQMVTDKNYFKCSEIIHDPSVKALKMLIDMGTDINVKDSKNVNCLFYLVAVPFGRHERETEADVLEKVKLLVEHGSDIDDGNTKYNGLFCIAPFLNDRSYPSVKEYIISVKPELKFKVGRVQDKNIFGGGTTKTTSSGCYVATAVYGSYDCPQVWTLRRYRDFRLAKSWYGRLFIKIYYTFSPTLVKWFGKTNWFKKMWRGRLDRMVKNLQSEGFESTPYND